MGERVRARLRLRERDHLANVLLPCEDGGEAVDAEREPRVGWGTEPERVQEEAEAGRRLLGIDAQQGEDPLLDVEAVDPNAAGAELPTVEHEVVGLRSHR